MKLTLIFLLLCSACCKGQQEDISIKRFKQTLKDTKPYFDSIGRDNDKRMFANGYIKAIDSVKINFGVSEFENAENIKTKEHYQWADSVWISYDSTYIVFRYFTKPNIPPTNVIKLVGTTYDTLQLPMPRYMTLQIADDTGTVFYFEEENNILFISDSLRTIKWLIQLVIENAKIPKERDVPQVPIIYKRIIDSVHNNIPPIALAGIDQVISPKVKTIKLKGIGIDEDGTIVAYYWKQIYGDKVTIKTPTSPDAIITGITGWGIYIFQLTVTDNNGDTDKDNVMIKVKYF